MMSKAPARAALQRKLCALALVFASLGATARAVDREVGPGRTHATISAALAAAAAGDTIRVFSGTYNERIVWNKAVDIIAAPGANAILRPTDAAHPEAAPLFLIDISLAEAATVTWEGIHVVNASTKFSRFFLVRGGHAEATVKIRNVSVTDEPGAGGQGRIFSAETGKLELENVRMSLHSLGQGPGYEMGIGAMGENVEVRARNSFFAVAGGKAVFGEFPSASMTFDGCTFNRRSGPTGFLVDIFDGTYTFNDCFFTGGDSTIRGLLLRAGREVARVECNRSYFDPNASWRAVQVEKAVEMTFTNCCFPTSGEFSILHNNATKGGGDSGSMTFTHCTFSSTVAGGARSGIRDETVTGATVEYRLDNCLFYIPGSTHGAIHGNTQGGTAIVDGTRNFIFSDSPAGAPGILTGLIEVGDPKISTFDFCHIVDEQSEAIDIGLDLGITDDIDGESRTLPPDYGCDEFSPAALAAPDAPASLTALAGNAIVRLSWSPPAGGSPVAGYNVFKTAPGPEVKVNELLLTGLDFTVTGLQNGTEHCFRVQSIGVSGAQGGSTGAACGTPSGEFTITDLEVGPPGSGKEFQSIQAAINAARPGGVDRVLVFSGEYNEKLLIQKQVNIVEAPGEEAVMRITDEAGSGFTFEFVGLGDYSVTWDGIDVVYAGSSFTRLFLARFNNRATVVNIRNMKLSDTPDADGFGMRFFTVEVAGTMNLENVEMDLVSQCPPCYEIVFGSMTSNVTATAKNSSFKGLVGGKMLSCEGGNTARMTIDSCTIESTGPNGALADFHQGIVEINDTTFKGRARQGLLCRFFGRLNLTCNRTTWDAEAPWTAVTIEKAITANFTNCCFPRNPLSGPPYSILASNPQSNGGPNSVINLRHCTFAATAEHPENTGMRARTSAGTHLELAVENCLFDLPGSSVGAIHDASEGGTNDVIAGTNLRNLLPSDGLAAFDLLEADPAGTLIEGEAGLEADFCHISPPSDAIDAGLNIGVHVDIDRETRPPEKGVDLGADEFSGTPAPACGVQNLVCNVGDGIELSWSILMEPAECRCARIEVRTAAGDVLASLPGNVTRATIPCSSLPASGSLCVVCIGPDGTEKSACCQYTCQTAPIFNRGDADDNGALQLTDAIRVLSFLFLGQQAPTCMDAADADDNGRIELTDAIRILQFLFLGQAPPAPPGPPELGPCGPDPTPNDAGTDLGCERYTSC
jgi:hypothetical protein